MPIISKHPENYSTWDFVSTVYNKFSDDKVTVIDTMWTENNELKSFVEKALGKNHKVVIMNWLDELRGEWRDEIYKEKDVLVVKNLWPLLKTCEQSFQTVTWEEVYPTNFNYDFMCYMFKVKPWRTELHKKLKGKNGLLSLMHERNFVEQINYTWGNTNIEPVSDDGNVVADIYSFGDMDLWRSHFLNVVSEGQHGVYYPVWITEKTFKPIMGARPFIVYGHPETALCLKEIGFETYDNEFDHTPQPDYVSHSVEIAKVVDNLKGENLSALYENLLDKIRHNFYNWKTYANTQHNKMIEEVLDFVC
tara:strand:- start:117 stop:1034 length:918 start_codon:yes stop_codon:yes gene_type:complete